MPKLTGIFDYFNGVGEIPVEDISKWFKKSPNKIILENFIANRVLYPQVIPISPSEMELDIVIFKEVLKQDKLKYLPMHKNLFDRSTKKIYIPKLFLERIPNLNVLVMAFIDAFILNLPKKNESEDIWTVVLEDTLEDVLGSVVLPRFTENTGIISIKLNDKKYEVKQGSVMVLPCSNNRCPIDFEVKEGKLIGKRDGVAEVSGGQLGVIVDGRSLNNG